MDSSILSVPSLILANIKAPRRETNPISPKHPFWYSSVGSEMRLHIDNSEIQYLKVSVVDKNDFMELDSNSLYEIKVIQNNKSPTFIYNKKDAISAIKNEWMKYYEDRTIVEYIEKGEIGSESARKIFPESNPPTPSPKSVRRNSIKARFNAVHSPRLSPRLTPKLSPKLAPNQPLTPRQRSRSYSSSPRSFSNSPRDNSISGNNSGNSSGNNSKSGSKDNSPRFLSLTPSPRTSKMLQQVSSKLKRRSSKGLQKSLDSINEQK